MRHTTFRFALDPTPAQAALFARHAGASRFAYNQCLEFVTDALKAKVTNPSAVVPWSEFDLINAFNAWKRSEAAGRILIAAQDGNITKEITGLAWRHEVSAQVFEKPPSTSVELWLPTSSPGLASVRDAASASRSENVRAVLATASGSETSTARAAPSASGSERIIPAR